MAARTEKALLRDGAAWVRRKRETLGWSPGKLAIRCRMMRICQIGVDWRGRPTAADVVALEAGELKQLPRWLTLVQDIFAFEEMSPGDREAWLARRNWYNGGHPVDLAEVLVFRDEFRLLAALQDMDEADRRAWRSFIAKWPKRSGREADRIDAATEWMRRIGVATAVLAGDERQLIEDYRRLRPEKRAGLALAVRDEVAWPPPAPLELDEIELTLLGGFRSQGQDGRYLLHELATKPKMLDLVIDLLKKAYPAPIAGAEKR